VCHSGSLPNSCVAKLAKLLKVTVEAPTKEIAVGDFIHQVGGKFKLYHP
jgi:hypothetical protein